MSASNFTRWLAYRKSTTLAISISELAREWPKYETYSLTDQVRRSSRAVSANLGESYGKRRYPKHFVAKITDAASENYETQVWLQYALLERYITQTSYDQLIEQAEEIGRLLSYMTAHPDKFR